MSNPLLYFHHGWGYSKDFWQKIAAHFPKNQIILADAGYFGAEATPLPEQDFIIIGHSLGFMHLLSSAEANSHCRGILGINAFACFAQKEDFKEGISPRILAIMQRNLRRNPHKVLNDFYKMCGDSKEISSEQKLNLESLHEGLESLSQDDQRKSLKKLEKTNKILAMLSGTDDPLAPAKKQWMTSQTERAGGHLLPLTHPEFCATWIKKHLEF